MKTYMAQVLEHLAFLQNLGIEVHSLQTGSYIRCRKIGQPQGRGDYTYYSYLNQMQHSYIGLVTWCRGASGRTATYKTFGLSSDGSEREYYYSHYNNSGATLQSKSKGEEIVEHRARAFWAHSSLFGLSNYLIQKGVGSYGIRFRSSEQYGNVAVVPMLDIDKRLWSYQLLNPNGEKRFPKGSRTTGLFHTLAPLVDRNPTGIAESYVTAATCLELSGISVVCCFSANNMPLVASSIRNLYPNSPIILFADNDRHLEEREPGNKGILTAQIAIANIKKDIYIVSPDFIDTSPSKEASDWNDLVRIKGLEFAKESIQKKI